MKAPKSGQYAVGIAAAAIIVLHHLFWPSTFNSYATYAVLAGVWGWALIKDKPGARMFTATTIGVLVLMFVIVFALALTF